MITRVQIFDFLSIEHADVDLHGIQAVSVIGKQQASTRSNSAGKSAFVESIRFVITARHRYRKDVEVIRRGATTCRVCLDFAAPDALYTIDRRLKKNHKGSGTNGAIQLFKNGELIASSVNECNSLLTSLFGSPQDFDNTSFFVQQQFTEFINNRPGDRIRFVEKFFKLDIFDRAKKAANRERGQIQQKIDQMNGKLSILAEDVKSIDLKELRATKIRMKKQYEQAKKEILEMSKELGERDAAYNTLQQLRLSLNTLRNENRTNNYSIQTSLSAIEKHESDIDKLKKNTCPFCNQLIKTELAEQSKKKLIKLIQQEQQVINCCKETLQNNEKQIELLITKEKELSKVIEHFSKKQQVFNNAKVTIRSVKKERSLLNQQILAHKEKKEKLKLVKKEIICLRQTVGDYATLSDIFNKGRTRALTEGLAEIQQTATSLVKNIGATCKEISFSTLSETAKGSVIDTLDVEVTDERGTTLVEGISGSDRDLVSFAIRVAMALYATERLDAVTDFLVLDEVLAAFDDNSRNELLSLICSLKQFDQIIVVTHTDVKSAFDDYIEACMDNAGITHIKLL